MTLKLGDRVTFIGTNGRREGGQPYLIQGKTLSRGAKGTVARVDEPHGSWPFQVQWEGHDQHGTHSENELELIMAESDSNKIIADRLRFIANRIINGDVASADVLRAYADELDPRPVTVTLSRRHLDILAALVDGGNNYSMTNRASMARDAWQVGTITADEVEELLEALEDAKGDV